MHPPVSKSWMGAPQAWTCYLTSKAATRSFLFNAVNFRKEPGYIGVLENQEIPAIFTYKDSLHHLGLVDVLAAAQLLDVAPREICLIGIQPHIIETGLELSELLQAKLSLLLACILAKLQDWGLPAPCASPQNRPLNESPHYKAALHASRRYLITG